MPILSHDSSKLMTASCRLIKLEFDHMLVNKPQTGALWEGKLQWIACVLCVHAHSFPSLESLGVRLVISCVKAQASAPYVGA